MDLRERWLKIVEDLPESVGGIIQLVGEMPETTLDDIPLRDAVRYSARDADATCRIDPVLALRHRDLGLGLVEQIDLGAVPMFERMQANGIKISRKHFEDLGTLLHNLARGVEKEIWAIAGEEFNVGSGDQVARILFDKLRLRSFRKTKSKTRLATDEKTLQALRSEHPIVPLILDHREYTKLKGTYADALPRRARESDDRIYANFRITRTPTGQLAVSNPNLVAIPVESDLGRETRRGFIPREGCVMGTWDFNQFHMRVMAHLSGDEGLCTIFEHDLDLHTLTAADMFGVSVGNVDKVKHRFPAKRTGFGIINGITAVGLSRQFDKAAELGAEPHDEKECDEFIKAWFRLYPGVKKFQDRKIAEARRYGYASDQYGRRVYLPNIHAEREDVRAEAERQSYTQDTHGTAFGVMKKGMKLLWDYLREYWTWDQHLTIEPVLQIHDELLFEIQRELTGTRMVNEITELLKTAETLRVPLGVNHATGPNWGDLDKT